MRVQAIAAIAAAFFLIHSAALAQQARQQQMQHDEDHILLTDEEVEWKDGPASLEEGSQFAVLEGDPSQSGIFTMRLKLPPGFQIAPHTHPRVERVTVLEGEFRIGMGSTFEEEQLKDLPVGSYFSFPPGMQHFAAACSENGTVIQLTSQGPWEIHYVNPSDDPRRQERQAAERSE
jgi:quercetin dioxygenase-like cupin family protein